MVGKRARMLASIPNRARAAGSTDIAPMMQSRTRAGAYAQKLLRIALPWAVRLMAAATWLACNVPEPDAASGGVHLPATACGRGVVILESDYASTNVALASFDGAVVSGSFISSGSRHPGLSMALSGDVVTPRERPLSGSVVLLDRYPNAVVTWVDPESAIVQAQLSVATGFASNPHDYIELGDGRAYVSRYETNPAPGREAWDDGGDLLIVNLAPAAIEGRIALSRPDDGVLLPRPDRMLRAGGHVWVLLQRFDASFSRAGDARIAGVDAARDRVDWVVDLPGVASCGGIELSASGARVAVVCSGTFGEGAAQSDRSGVVLLDATVSPPVETRRFDAAAVLGAPLAPAVGFLDDNHVLGVAYGDLVAGRADNLYAIDLVSGAIEQVHAAGQAFVLGDIRCSAACGGPCLVADAELGGLWSWRLDGGAALQSAALPVSDAVGLPPRGLGGF